MVKRLSYFYSAKKTHIVLNSQKNKFVRLSLIKKILFKQPENILFNNYTWVIKCFFVRIAKPNL